MSEWTSLAAKVFKSRYDLTAWQWAAKPEDTYRANAILEARLGLILYPGQGAYVESPAGWFAENTAVGTQLHAGKSSRVLPLISFRGIPQAFGAESLSVTDNDAYVDTGQWFRQDWDLSTLVRAGLSPAYRDYLETARRIWYKVLTTLDWIPNSVAVSVDRAISVGFLPAMQPVSAWTASWGPLPSWMANPYRQSAWDGLRGDLATLNQEVSTTALVVLHTRAQQLEASREFWDGVARYSGVDAIGAKWDELMRTIQRINKANQITRDSITQMRALVTANPSVATTDQMNRLGQLEQAVQQSVAGARAAVPTSVNSALAQDGAGIQGLGLVPAVGVALGVTLIVSITAVLGTWMVLAESTARKAMDLQQELILQAEAAANHAYAQTQEAIITRQRELDALLDQGQISRTEYDRQMAALNHQVQSAGVALAQRRAQTKDLAQAHAANLDTLRTSAFAGGLASIKGIAMWGALAAGVLVLGPKLLGD